jgi:hypothetical protein
VNLAQHCLLRRAAVKPRLSLSHSRLSDGSTALPTGLFPGAQASPGANATARVAARARAWTLSGTDAPDHGISIDSPLIIDLDATLTNAHSEKQNAASTFKRGFGFHSLWSFIDHDHKPWRGCPGKSAVPSCDANSSPSRPAWPGRNENPCCTCPPTGPWTQPWLRP